MTSIIPKNLTKQTKVYLYLFVFTMLSGALRKWLFNSAAVGNIIFALQMSSLFIFIFFDKKTISTVFKNDILKIYVSYLIICAINPQNATIYHGLLGILLHFGFWFIAFYYLENRGNFNFTPIIPLLLILCLAEIFLATVQYGLPTDSVFNRYSDKNYTDIATVGEAVRVTGSFSFIAGFTSYLLFHAYFLWALVKLKYDSKIIVGLLFIGLVGAFMSGSRTGGYSYFVLAFYTLIFVARGGIVKTIFSGFVIPVCLILTFSLINGSTLIQKKITDSVDNYFERASALREQGEEKSRITGEYENLLNFRGSDPIFGIGLGATYSGANILLGTSEAFDKYGFIESENEKVVLEGGFILFFFKIALIITFCRRLAVDTLSKFIMGALLYLAPPQYNVLNSWFAFFGIAMVDHFYFKAKNGVIN